MHRSTSRHPGIAFVHAALPVALLASMCAALLAACGGAQPEPIALNQDGCDYCRMVISDARFGGEAITGTGRVHKFDSVECLAGWVRAAAPGTARALYVIDLAHPGSFVPAGQAGYLHGGLVRSPMGREVVAFASMAAAEQMRAMLGGRVMSWADVLADTAKAPVGNP